MLGRHIVGYAPSLVVTAVTSFASVTLFTSLMSQAEYGQYALAVNMMTMLVGVCFFWLQSASSRLMPQAVEQNTQVKLFTTLYGAFAGCGIALLALSLVLSLFGHLGDWRIAAWFAAPLAVLRALLNLNQSIHRNFVRIARYNAIEIGQSVIGLSCAAVLILCFHHPESDAVTGTMIGFAVMCLFDWQMLRFVKWRNFDWAAFHEIAQFGAPFILTYGLSFILSGSDRFLIEYFLGPAQVGVYSAGYALPDRIGQNLFMVVATASFPLVIRRLESEGVDAARDQTYTNGVALLALAVPACVGMLMVNKQIAAVLIGADFRAGAVMIMPWITMATILNGIAAHYFDHAFHLAKKTRLFFCTLGPAALLNFAGNLYAIPRFGIIGAAWTTLAAYALYLSLSIIIGRQVFRIKFPFRPALHIAVSAGAMGLILSLFDFPENAFGLIGMIVIGGIVYAAGLFVFDVMGVRSFIKARWGGRRDFVSNNAELKFEILTSIAQAEAISDEWKELYNLVGYNIFGSYEWFSIWWKNLGSSEKIRLRIVTARSSADKLVGILPLVTRRSGFVQILEWAGHSVFDYGDVLAVNTSVGTALWEFVSANRSYDIALIKDVHCQAQSLSALSGLMQTRGQRKNYFLTFNFTSGDAWLAAQSRKLRGDARRKMEKMQAKGAVAFDIYKNGDEYPVHVIDALYQQKAAWFAERFKTGAFAQTGIKNFLHDLARDAARRGELYLTWLTCGDVIVACHMGFVRDNILYLYHTTYHADYAEFSPGNAMMIETIRYAIDSGMRELDFMRGDEAYKQRFAGDHRLLADFVSGRSVIGKVFAKFKSVLASWKSKQIHTPPAA